MSTQSRQGPRPPAVVAVALVLLLQALGVLVAAAGFGVQVGTGSLNLGAQVFLVVLMVAAGFWIGAVGLGLWRGRPWVRAATVVIEMFAVILSISFFSAGNVLMGALFLLPAAVALVLMFSRQVASYLAGLPS
ncbi:hypothetical protein [Citricoccus sp. CH26A]|uniref:hypothetical protein n=1 Tax=Citricoccus TaxID=169133 RepID=UPI0011454DC2|nr:hypothetical protein [Citricoccus sp. CH26A]